MRRALFVTVLLTLAVPGFARAQVQPVTWCGGSDETPANRIPDLEAAASQQIRFLYVLPTGEPDHFAQYASGIATDAAWIDQWWEREDPTRTPRFDRYPFPNCPSKYGALDIGVKRLEFPASTYLVPDAPAAEVDLALRGLLPGSQKTIVYFDGPIRSKTKPKRESRRAQRPGRRERQASKRGSGKRGR